MKLKPLSEREIQNQIIGYLQYKKFYVFRMNSGRIPQESNGKRRLIRLMPAGTPDLLAIKDGKALFVEVKRKGKKPTLLQKLKMEELERFGAKCVVATCIEDLGI